MSQNGYPTPGGHHPLYWIIDGRHRYCAAVYNGRIRELRCDVIDGDGRHGLRVLPAEELAVDPEVQFPFAYNDTVARRLARKWDDRKVGVLTVVPIDNALNAAMRADIKNGIDRDRRQVRPIESFLNARKAGELEAVQIGATVEQAGYELGRLSRGRPYNRIEAVLILQKIFRTLGAEGLRRTLYLNTNWKGDPKTNTTLWLEALALLVRDGYDQALTPRSLELWKEVVPAVELRHAQGEVITSGNTTPAAYALAGALRKKARLRSRPVNRTRHDGHSRPF